MDDDNYAFLSCQWRIS